MYNYSKITKDSLKKDVGETIKIIQNLVLEIKQSEDIHLDSFDYFEREISDLSGRVTFMGDVHTDEEIRNYANEAESIIENYVLETITDIELYRKFLEIDHTSLDGESLKYYKDLERDFIDAGHNLDEKEAFNECERNMFLR